MNKLKQRRLFLLSLVLFIAIFVLMLLKKNSVTVACKNIDQEKAIGIAKQLPEVKKYLSTGDRITRDQTSKAVVDVDGETTSLYKVHVYSNEQYLNDPEMGHAATMNWYAVDKCTGKIKCSFAEYDNLGEYVKNNDGYPCD